MGPRVTQAVTFGKCGGCGTKIRWSPIREGYVPATPDRAFVTHEAKVCPGSYGNHWPEWGVE